MDLHETAASRLVAHGQRYTGNRRVIVQLLEGSDVPLSVPEVRDADPELPQSSVYRNLSVLEEAGVVRRIVAGGDFARYELAEDLTEHHHHLICSSCGSVEDFTVPASLERSLGRAMAQMEGERGFAATTHRLDLMGSCESCQ